MRAALTRLPLFINEAGAYNYGNSFLRRTRKGYKCAGRARVRPGARGVWCGRYRRAREQLYSNRCAVKIFWNCMVMGWDFVIL